MPAIAAQRNGNDWSIVFSNESRSGCSVLRQLDSYVLLSIGHLDSEAASGLERMERSFNRSTAKMGRLRCGKCRHRGAVIHSKLFAPAAAVIAGSAGRITSSERAEGRVRFTPIC